MPRRARFRRFWYSHVCDMIKSYYQLEDTDSLILKKWKMSIDVQMNRLLQSEDGARKVKAVYMVLIDKTHTKEGASLELYASHHTVTNWIIDFVYSVGYEMGYK